MNLQNTNERQVQKQLQKRHQGKNKCKSSDKNLDNTSRLIEVRSATWIHAIIPQG
jgi:hypothetical protein